MHVARPSHVLTSGTILLQWPARKEVFQRLQSTQIPLLRLRNLVQTTEQYLLLRNVFTMLSSIFLIGSAGQRLREVDFVHERVMDHAVAKTDTPPIAAGHLAHEKASVKPVWHVR